MANDLGIKVVEGDFTPYDLYNADEAFLAGTSPTIVPVQSVNGLRIGNQVPGPVTLRLINAWSKMVNVDIALQALSHLDQKEQEQLLKVWQEKKAA
jgi:branched-chain amino acid aminotransferase